MTTSKSSWIPMNLFRLMFLLLGLILLTGTGEVRADISEDINKYLQYTDSLKGLWNQTLTSLYKLSQQFIVTITPKGLVQELLVNQLGFNLSDAGSFMSKISNISLSGFNINTFGPKAADAAVGYIVIVGMGFILILFFMLACGCFCCCRKVGCCCGKVAAKDPGSSDVPIIVVLYVFVAGFSVLLFLSTYGSVVTGVVAADVLKNDNQTGLPLVGNLLPVFNNLASFVNGTLDDISMAINVTEMVGQFNVLAAKLTDYIQNKIQNIGSQCASCSSLINGYKNLTSYGSSLLLLLDGLNSTQTDLNSRYATFNLTLENFKVETRRALGNCSDVECQYLQGNLTMLTLLRQPFQSANLSSLKDTLNTLINGNNNLFGNFSSLTDEFSGVANTFLQTIKDQIDSFIGTARSYTSYLNINQYLSAITPALSPYRQAFDIIPAVMKGVAIGIGSVLFLICFLNVLGLVFGPACINKSPKTGQRLFMASSYLSFLIGSVISTLAIVLFIIGTPLYREGCLDLQKSSNSTYFGFADRLIQQQLKSFESIPLPITPESNISLKIDVQNLFVVTKIIEQDCASNRSLVDAFLDVVILDNQTVNALVNSFDTCFLCALNLSALPIFQDSAINQMRRASETIASQNFSVPLNESVPLLIPDLEILKTSMINARNKAANTTAMDVLISQNLSQINNTAINISAEEKQLFGEIAEAKYLLKNISQILLQIANYSLDARVNLGNFSTDALVQDVKNLIAETFLQFYQYLRGKLGKVSKCRNLYDVFNIIIHFFCDLIVNPVNAYWFITGISVVLLVLGFLSGLWLGGLLARRQKASPNYVEESEDGDQSERASSGTGGRVKATSRQTVRAVFPLHPPDPDPYHNAEVLETPRSSSGDDVAFENSSLYYVPAIAQQSRPVSNYRPTDPYYNLPYLRVPRSPSALFATGLDVRIPRPWRPVSTAFVAPAAYTRF